MKSGQCPKCGCASVVAHNNGILPDGGAWTISGPRVFYFSTEVITLVCTSCGYFENYLTNPEKLNELARTWQKVPPRGR